MSSPLPPLGARRQAPSYTPAKVTCPSCLPSPPTNQARGSPDEGLGGREEVQEVTPALAFL